MAAPSFLFSLENLEKPLADGQARENAESSFSCGLEQIDAANQERRGLDDELPFEILAIKVFGHSCRHRNSQRLVDGDEPVACRRIPVYPSGGDELVFLFGHERSLVVGASAGIYRRGHSSPPCLSKAYRHFRCRPSLILLSGLQDEALAVAPTDPFRSFPAKVQKKTAGATGRRPEEETSKKELCNE